MRNVESFPVYHNGGTAYEPSDATTTARAKRVIRTYYCKHTKTTKKVVRQVHITHGKGNEADVVRTSLIERTPARRISTGFHLLEERRAEAVERSAAWRGLSFKDQLKALDRRPGESKKQRARILAAMEASEDAKNPPKVPGMAGGVNKKHTSSEKMARAMTHAQAASSTSHPTTRRRGPKDAQQK